MKRLEEPPDCPANKASKGDDEKRIEKRTPAAMRTEVVPLEDLGGAEIDDLFRISQDPEVMRWIGDSRPWSREKIAELAEWAKRDRSSPAEAREFWSWAIVGVSGAGRAIVGFVSLRPTKDDKFPGLQLRFFVSREHQRKGHAAAAVSSAMREFASRLGRSADVFAFVKPENTPSASLLAKLGFAECGTKMFGREAERAFKGIAVPAPSSAPPVAAAAAAARATKSRDCRGEDDFPYRRAYMPPFPEMFARVRAVAESPPGEWSARKDDRALGVVERTFPEEYESTDSLTDHFAEPARIRCREKGHPSPLEAWVTLKRGARWGSGKALPSGTHERREAVYRLSRGCNLFNASLAVHLVARFGGRGGSVLDCTAGWGDRLVAAHAAGAARYRGWDTNPELGPVYSSLAAACVSAGADPVDWSVQCAPFESVPALFAEGGELHGSFDIALVCPPYFDQELYNGPATSSTVHATYRRWIDGFYLPMLRQARNALKAGGHLLGYVRPGDLEGEARKELSNGMEYLGALGFRQTVRNAKSPGAIRDTFVWKKL